MMKKTLTAMLLLCLLLTLVPMASLAAGSGVKDVWLETKVHSVGQKMEAFYVTVEDPAILEGLTKDDFTIQGLATDWRGSAPTAFEALLTGIAVEGDLLTITVDYMAPKWFYVDSLNVTCQNARLSFTKDDLSKVVTPYADDFVAYRTADGAAFDYNFFTPANADEGPLPLVLALHGSGDHLNLLQNRVALVFAEPQIQQSNPCYVLAPLFNYPEAGVKMENELVLDKSVEFIRQLIAEGKVDASRIYVTGKSMGGGNTLRVIRKYPEVFAAALPMCGGGGNEGDDISMLADMPIYIVVNEADRAALYEGCVSLYNRLVELGNEDAKLFVYTKHAMDVTGFPNYHDVEVLVTSNYQYYDWLFAQVKE